MFKKTKYTLICLLAIMLTVLAFTACKSEHTPSDEPDDPSGSIQRPEENDPDHVHTTGDAVIEDEIAATCKSEGSYYEVVYCTECNKAISKKKVTTDKLSQHTYANGTCTVCGETQKFSEGLEYEEFFGKFIVSCVGTCTDTSIIIPAVYNDKPVVGIKERAFSECKNITEIIIPDSVTSIGKSAFSWCPSLMSVILPDSITDIGEYMFAGCDKLTEIDIPDSVTNIGEHAFYSCESLTNIDIPISVSSIGDYAFSGCSNLASVVIPDDVKSIGNSVFSLCSELESVFIPDSVTTIGSYAFHNCANLINIVIPDSVTNISYYAFDGCSGLTSVTIGSGVTSIGDYAFDGCYRLVEVINRSSLEINAGSWKYGRIAYNAMIVHSGATLIKNTADYLFITLDGVNYLLRYAGSDTEITLPDNHNGENYIINDCAFRHCDKLTNITIGKGVTTIGDYAFYGCTGLTSIVIPDSVTSIGDSAFNGCNDLVAIAYTGTEEKWKAINIEQGNDKLTSATIIYNYTE